MKQITIEVSDKIHNLLSTLVRLKQETIEKFVVESLLDGLDVELQLPAGDLYGLNGVPGLNNYDEVLHELNASPDTKVIK